MPGHVGGVDLSVPQRQSPIAAVFLVIKTIRSIGIVQIVFGVGFVLARSPSIAVLAISVTGVLLIALAISGLSWWRYTFSVQDGELRVENGVLSRNRLTVPLDRVQGVSIEQKFLHRFVGLVEVTADTAGTAVAEFNLSAVNRSVAEALQSVSSDHRASTAAAAASDTIPAPGSAGVLAPAPAQALPDTEERVVLKRTPAELLKIAFTTFPLSGLALLAPLAAIVFEFGDRIPIDAPDDVEFSPGLWLVWAIPLALLAMLAIGLLLNVANSFLRFWDLTITRTPSGLRRNAGLLSKSGTASSIPRIQIIRVRQSWVARFVDLREVWLVGVNRVLAANGPGGSVGPIVVPGCSEEQTEELRRIALDGAEGVSVLDRRVAPIATFQQTRNAAFVVIPLVIGLWFLAAWWPLLLLLLIPWRWAIVRRQTQLRRWGISSDAVADRRQLLGIYSNETLLRKINSITIRQSRFERKRDLATIGFVLAGGNVTIGMIPIDEAKAVRDRALYVAETDRRAFM